MKFLITFVIAVFITTGVTLAGIFTKHDGRALLYVVIIWTIFYFINKPRKRK